MTDPEVLHGGCECGHVRYEVKGTPYHRTLCHCVTCRRVAGAPAVAWFSVPTDALRVLQGAMTVYRSSPHATRAFCPLCGSHLLFREDALDEVDITTCSLDDPERVPPQDQTYVRGRLAWLAGIHGLPEHRTSRSADAPAP